MNHKKCPLRGFEDCIGEQCGFWATTDSDDGLGQCSVAQLAETIPSGVNFLMRTLLGVSFDD